MYRVVVTSGRGFDDQRTVQRALIELKKLDPHATLVIGTFDGEQIAGKVWTALGGTVKTEVPQWQIHGRDAGRIRDADILRKSADICLSLEHRGELPYLARRFMDNGVTVWRYSDDVDVIDAG
jgi:hypothetical protein